MRLEQAVTVRLSLGDVQHLQRQRTLAVQCGCGQTITLAWDSEDVSAVVPKPKAAVSRKSAGRPKPKAASRKNNGRLTPSVLCTQPGCSRTFKNAHALRMHLVQHEKKASQMASSPVRQTSPLSCPVQGCTHPPFMTAQGLSMHRRRAHEGFNPIPKAGTA